MERCDVCVFTVVCVDTDIALMCACIVIFYYFFLIINQIMYLLIWLIYLNSPIIYIPAYRLI